MTEIHATVTATSSTNRSRVTNGSAVLEGIDGRSRDGRRYRDLLDGYATIYGATGEADLALCRGAARLALMLEREDAKLARGEPVALGDTARATSRLQRILRDLAASARARKRGRA